MPGPLLGAGCFYGSQVLDEGATHGVRLTALTALTLVAWPAEPLRAAALSSPSLLQLLEALRRPGLRAVLPRLVALDDVLTAPLRAAATGDESVAVNVAVAESVPHGASRSGASSSRAASSATATENTRPMLDREGEEAARWLVQNPPEVVGFAAGEVLGTQGLHILDEGVVREEGALLAPGSLLGAVGWLLGVVPLQRPRAEGAVRVLRWGQVPPVVHSALARLVTADGGRLRGAQGQNLDRSHEPTVPREAADYEPTGRAPGPGPFPPFLRQREAMDCGAACLRMVHAHYGHPLSHRFAVRLARVSRYGTSLLDLARAAEQLGYRATGARIEGWPICGRSTCRRWPMWMGTTSWWCGRWGGALSP